MKRDAKWYKLYYVVQYMLSQDRWYMESIRKTDAGPGNGVRKESSLPFSLINLAAKITDLEMGSKLVADGSQEYLYWKLYRQMDKFKANAPMEEKPLYELGEYVTYEDDMARDVKMKEYLRKNI